LEEEFSKQKNSIGKSVHENPIGKDFKKIQLENAFMRIQLKNSSTVNIFFNRNFLYRKII
jgi:Ni,Fe-hydrogenase III large subunit